MEEIPENLKWDTIKQGDPLPVNGFVSRFPDDPELTDRTVFFGPNGSDDDDCADVDLVNVLPNGQIDYHPEQPGSDPWFLFDRIHCETCPDLERILFNGKHWMAVVRITVWGDPDTPDEWFAVRTDGLELYIHDQKTLREMLQRKFPDLLGTPPEE